MSWAERRDRLLPNVVPILLVIIAAMQFYNERYNQLTPWKGGGFGMFSTVDEPGRRLVRCYLVGEEGQQVPVRIPPKLDRLAWEVRSIPTQDRVSSLARAVADDLNESFAKAGALVRARSVRAEVWRMTFDSQSREVRAEQLAEATVER